MSTDAARPRTGVFTGAYAINPVTDERIPVWIADYVLMGYGTGAIMAVPSATSATSSSPARSTCRSASSCSPRASELDPATMTEAYAGDGMLVNSGPFDGTRVPEGVPAIIAWLAEQGRGRRRGQLPPARLADLPPTLLGHADPDRLLRRLRHRAGAGRSTAGDSAAGRGVPADRPEPAGQRHEEFLQRRLSDVRRRRPGARPTRWTPSSIRRGTGSATLSPHDDERPFEPERGGEVDVRSISTAAASSTRFCTCSTPASSPRSCATSV